MKKPAFPEFIKSIKFVGTRLDASTKFRRIWGYLLSGDNRIVTFWVIKAGPFEFKYADSYVDQRATTAALVEDKVTKGYVQYPEADVGKWNRMADAYRDFLYCITYDKFYQPVPLGKQTESRPPALDGVVRVALTPARCAEFAQREAIMAAVREKRACLVV